ncbi:MAG: type II toxin-antitoxin system RelE/ParE family toxin [Sulfuritalea sp.]|mgnify:CR=1 FL=1|jgi:toxin ParE1/3/4|nr:type II toxin-antitoxin system RelE/ParE family toxin [Sulfuritalea sp.]
MRVIFSPEARTEFDDAVRYYDQQRQGLGDELRGEIRDFLPRLKRSPLTFPAERGDIRRLILARFPYKLLYSVETDHVYVIALAHRRRAPDYRVDRTG